MTFYKFSFNFLVLILSFDFFMICFRDFILINDNDLFCSVNFLNVLILNFSVGIFRLLY